MKTMMIIICSMFLSTGLMAQGEQQYSKVQKNRSVKVRANAVNSRSNPPDAVVLRRQSKPRKPKEDRFRFHDQTAFNARLERKNKGS